jgi:hypothetical protein
MILVRTTLALLLPLFEMYAKERAQSRLGCQQQLLMQLVSSGSQR